MLATYFAHQTPHRNEDVLADAALEQRGKAVIAAQNCATCHGDRLTGSTIAPRLAGQGEIYLGDQLAAFKHGTRQDPTEAMNTMANALSEDDIKIVARYAAGLPPTPK
jgi:cytochrome c553